jgi:hypothetical protein
MKIETEGFHVAGTLSGLDGPLPENQIERIIEPMHFDTEWPARFGANELDGLAMRYGIGSDQNEILMPGAFANSSGEKIIFAFDHRNPLGIALLREIPNGVYFRARIMGSRLVCVELWERWEAAEVTQNESTHTHDVDPPATTSGVPSATAKVAADMPGIDVGDGTRTHDTAIGSFASGSGSAHHHALVDADAQLKVPSEVNGGLGLRIAVTFYIRR